MGLLEPEFWFGKLWNSGFPTFNHETMKSYEKLGKVRFFSSFLFIFWGKNNIK